MSPSRQVLLPLLLRIVLVAAAMGACCDRSANRRMLGLLFNSLAIMGGVGFPETNMNMCNIYVRREVGFAESSCMTHMLCTGGELRPIQVLW